MSKITLYKAKPADKGFWENFGNTFPEGNAEQKLIIAMKGEKIGIMHCTLLWNELPFLNHLIVSKELRGNGYGENALLLWENRLRIEGFRTALLSTRAAESAQYFFRKLGYTDCGALDMSGFTKPQADAELFLYKNL